MNRRVSLPIVLTASIVIVMTISNITTATFVFNLHVSLLTNFGYASNLNESIINNNGKPSSSSSSLFRAGELYVGNAISNSVSVVDLSTNQVIENISVGDSPHDIKISDDQQIVYTTDTDSGTISIINASSKSLIDQIKTNVTALHGIAIRNDTLYAGDVYGGRVLVIKGGQIIDQIKVGSGPEYIEISPDGRFMYVANLWSPISVVDLRDGNKVIKSIDSGITPHGLSFNKNGSRLFIVNMHSNTLSVIDSQKHEIIKTISVGDRPEYVKLTPDEKFAYVTNLGSGTVSKVDENTIEVIDEIHIGDTKGPHGIAFSPGGNLMYISNMNGNDITVVDTSADKIVANINAGGIEPHQIIMREPSVRIGS
ncbi:MAG TPA: beta-propeller fold lactonase family protein [Nitrososphaeraceae archaeon]|nr:beta-propeller fold lactonase family protein [Nitrososphaeraceae archaeon]